MQEERAILTHNIADFVALALDYHQRQQTHYGIVVAPHLGIVVAPHLEKGVLIRRTMTLLESVTAAELMNTVRFI